MKKKISNRGITLLELLIVMVILATSLGLGVSLINRQENSIKKTFRQFIALNRQLDSYAKLNKTTYRWVINMDDEEGSTWWVEQKIGLALPASTDSTEQDKDDNKDDSSTKPFMAASGFLKNLNICQKT